MRLAFPEYSGLLVKYTLNEEPLVLYNHVGKVIIGNYKYIVSKDDGLFNEETTTATNTEFLPRILFHYLWNSELSENTQTTLWNYLTLLFVTIAKHSVDDVEDVDLSDILSKIVVVENDTTSVSSGENGEPKMPDITIPEDMPEALKGMMGGSLGKLAMELAKETMSSGVPSNGTPDLFGMMSKIGSSIDNKIKNGEISESDLLQESMNMMNSLGPGNMSAMMKMFTKPEDGSGVDGLDMSPLEIILNGNKSFRDRERKSQKFQDKKQRQNMRSKNPRNMADINSNESPEYTLPRFTDEELEKIFASK